MPAPVEAAEEVVVGEADAGVPVDDRAVRPGVVGVRGDVRPAPARCRRRGWSNARVWSPFMSSVIRVGGRCVSFAKNAPASCRVDSFLRSPRTPVPTPTADCLCSSAVAPHLVARSAHRGRSSGTRRRLGRAHSHVSVNEPSSRGSTTSSGAVPPIGGRPARAATRAAACSAPSRGVERDAQIRRDRARRTRSRRRPPERCRTTWAPKIAHLAGVLIEAVVDAAVDHRVLAGSSCRRRAPARCSVFDAAAPLGGGHAPDSASVDAAPEASPAPAATSTAPSGRPRPVQAPAGRSARRTHRVSVGLGMVDSRSQLGETPVAGARGDRTYTRR